MSLMQSVMLSLLCEREREWKWVCTYKREREREREETCVLCSLFSTGRTDSVRKWEREYCVCVCGVLPSKNQSWRGSFLSVSDLEREREREREIVWLPTTQCVGLWVYHTGGRCLIASTCSINQKSVCSSIMIHHPIFRPKGVPLEAHFVQTNSPLPFILRSSGRIIELVCRFKLAEFLNSKE